MPSNVGSSDRIIRIVVGLAIAGAGFYFKSYWGLVALLPLTTAAMRSCPAYSILGASTCPRD